MKLFKRNSMFLTILVMLLAVALTGCLGGNGGNQNKDSKTADTVSALLVTSVSPAADAPKVGTNVKVTATFNRAMDASTIDTFSFVVGAVDETPIPGTVTFDEASRTAIFTPLDGNKFAAERKYQARITTAVKDQNGMGLANAFVWSFTTGLVQDNAAPLVSSTNPHNGDTGVPRKRTLSATFNEAIDPTTINGDTFYLVETDDDDAVKIPGVVSYLPGTKTAFFDPESDLGINTSYTATITSGVKDLTIEGNALVEDEAWSFVTGTRAGSDSVELGTAGNFVILAKSGISTSGTTSIVGDIGLSPAAESFITGFSQARDSSGLFSTSNIVTGDIFAADMAAPTPDDLITAVGDMEIAYDDAAGRSDPDVTELGAGDISGLTLKPGLYKWGTGLLINSDVTLSGDANDVWILQIAQGLTVGNGVAVELTGGALAKNVFWQVTEGVTLGTTSDFKGIILTKTNIAINTGAVLNGRALAQTAVTLDANAITEPAE